MELNLITLNNEDLAMLSNRFMHLSELDFSSLERLEKSIKAIENDDTYKISDFLAISFGHINGVRRIFMHGNGHALSEIFGIKRVYYGAK